MNDRQVPLSPAKLVTRFAPSPTGFLHLGHVASAIYVWGIGRRLGADILLRLEDHDRGRSRPQFEASIFDDLAWLGLSFDNTDLKLNTPSPYRQSDSTAYYDRCLQQLGATHKLYGCGCSRRAIAAMAMQQAPVEATVHAPGDDTDESSEPRYNGHCRSTGLPPWTQGAGVRLVTPQAQVQFEDLCQGRQTQDPALQCGDLLLRDRHGQYTYQFAATADDLRHGVNLIIRGVDLLQSTGRQIWLGRELGRKEPATFLHHPLIKDAAGKKLGKRFFAAAIAERRQLGERPEAVLGEAAYHVGLTAEPGALTVAELPSLFNHAYAQWRQVTKPTTAAG